MTNWLPDLREGSGPLYLRLANRIEDDIGSGALPSGAKLPPQRNLAFDIGVTIGTVGRAYALARERGLVSGEVGRGTYILARDGQVDAEAQPSGTRLSGAYNIAPSPVGKLRMDSTAAPDVGQAAVIERLSSRIAREHPGEIATYTRTWRTSWMEAGSRWLSSGDWTPDPASVVPTLGGHAALIAIIAAVTNPGDKVAFEQLTFSSIARSTNLIGRRSITIDSASGTIDPESFERLCAQQHPKVAFLMPTIHNPTLTIIPEQERRDIVSIARKYNVWLIEDNIYGSLLDHGPTPLAELAPERTFHVGSLSKTVAAGVRGGWVSCPANLASRITTSHKMVTGGMPFLLADLSARLVLSGEAAAIRTRVKAEIAMREALARQHFAGLDFTSNPDIPFLWMKLPEPWLSGNFKKAGENEGVLIEDEDEFKSGRSERAFHRIRVAFSVPGTMAEVESGLMAICRLLDSGGIGHDPYT
ncbi:PLP-dependent aminotransferase family protein [Mesorhizobium sp. ZC-5]|uniref:aminotransferase-like domain-containing protein n=1 Tax=Mesorhizobium sp. ZC-5 TaxID=2986066 RepID=UPI0021E805A5|nr:PLP-dependent aminotransferase family protein [Mesorhizobium sp. ZC-5]MCV3241486.1 PLP-dependent aminotransferase family protein [Mesorhizobium sp. ZC-5]